MKSLLSIIAASLLASAFASQSFAQWTVQASGIPVDAQVVLAPVDENVCWAVTRDVGARYVSRTTNGGTNWIASSHDSLNDFGGISALNADTAWIASAGIYKTTNGGVSWTHPLSAGLTVVVHFFDASHGVCLGAASFGGPLEIYMTANGGELWSIVPSSNIPPAVNTEGFIPGNYWAVGNTIWVPTNGGFTGPGSLYKSTDRGLTWSATRNVVTMGGSFVAFKDSLNGLLSGGATPTVKRTTDGGGTWTTTGSVPDGVSPFLMAYVPGTSGSYVITSFTLSTQIPGSAYTLDDGASWTTVDNVLHGKSSFVSPTVGWSWGGANVIYKWTGELLVNKWTARNSGIPTGEQVVLAAVNADVCWGVTRATGGRYVSRTTDGGKTWVASQRTSLADFSSIAAISADTAWIATTGIYKTTNGGVSWTQPLSTTTPMLIVHFFDSNNGVCIGSAFAGPIEVYTTTDGGSAWTQVSNIPLASGGAIPGNYAAAGTTFWCPTNGGSLYKTTDRGVSWSAAQNVVGTTGGVFVAFKDATNGLATAENTVYRTTDGGAHWDPTGSGPNGVSAFLLSYIPGTSGSYMITSNSYPIPRLNGSAYTLDDGTSWTTVDTLPHGRAAFISPSVGWSWGGPNVIYKWTGVPFDVANSVRDIGDANVPSSSALLQNYPNPFNPSTDIRFQIAEHGLVSLKVYDLLGREGATLVDEMLAPGSYQITFNAKGLSSGVYFYRLHVRPVAGGREGELVLTKRLLLLR